MIIELYCGWAVTAYRSCHKRYQRSPVTHIVVVIRYIGRGQEGPPSPLPPHQLTKHTFLDKYIFFDLRNANKLELLFYSCCFSHLGFICQSNDHEQQKTNKPKCA